MQLSLWQPSPPRPADAGPLQRTRRLRGAPAVPMQTLPALEAQAALYAEKAHADGTRKAYQRDWAAFEEWCGGHGLAALPAAPHTLTLYLTELARKGLKASTIRRARVAIGLAHGHSGEPRPDTHASVRTLERGIAKVHGAREEGATPLLHDELARALRWLGSSPRDERDRALILLGYARGFRSANLAGFNMSDVTFTPAGVLLDVRKSKEDQLARGKRVEISFGSSDATCPVRALQIWIERVGRAEGPLFRVVRGCTVEHQRIHPRAVSRALQRVVQREGLDGKYSSHSLRAGVTTSAHLNGVSRRDIQEWIGWRDGNSVDRYTRLEGVAQPPITKGLL